MIQNYKAAGRPQLFLTNQNLDCSSKPLTAESRFKQGELKMLNWPGVWYEMMMRQRCLLIMVCPPLSYLVLGEGVDFKGAAADSLSRMSFHQKYFREKHSSEKIDKSSPIISPGLSWRWAYLPKKVSIWNRLN